ncbi:hypothetical protein [Micromonospora sp. DT231]|uniref:hypothetical protein n=1 Tax=Micromonospora sp. DT231 TaxID=3416526 RepID=UPI003CF9083C
MFRQPWTKSDAGWRMLVLPRFAVGMIMARKLVAAGYRLFVAPHTGTSLAGGQVIRELP